jgi:hypothetical protein
MKRSLLCLSTIALLLFPTSLYAQSSVKNYYVGAGLSYALEDIKFGDLDDSFGANAKIGCRAHNLLDLEFNFDWLREFKESGSHMVEGSPLDYYAEMRIMTFMFTLKGYFPVPSDHMRLAVVAGGGLMHAKAKAGFNHQVLSGSFSDNETDLCGKLGLAFDYYATPEISIGFEGNYTSGFSDLKDVNYWNFTVGVSYHF